MAEFACAHPWMTFFLVLAAISATVSIAKTIAVAIIVSRPTIKEQEG